MTIRLTMLEKARNLDCHRTFFGKFYGIAGKAAKNLSQTIGIILGNPPGRRGKLVNRSGYGTGCDNCNGDNCKQEIAGSVHYPW